MGVLKDILTILIVPISIILFMAGALRTISGFVDMDIKVVLQGVTLIAFTACGIELFNRWEV